MEDKNLKSTLDLVGQEKYKRFIEYSRMKSWRERNPEKYANARKRDSAKATGKRYLLKLQVLFHYGGSKCACVKCGESRLACLSIDHIEGNGNKQRKGSLRNSGAFYAWLKRNNYPVGYQTLCMNCQWVKRFDKGEHN